MDLKYSYTGSNFYQICKLVETYFLKGYTLYYLGVGVRGWLMGGGKLEDIFSLIYVYPPIYLGLHYFLYNSKRSIAILNIHVAIYNLVLIVYSLYTYYNNLEISKMASSGLAVSLAILWGSSALYDGIKQLNNISP